VTILRVLRDAGFWTAVASHPTVRGVMRGLDPALVGRLALDERFMPLAAEHGGFLIQRLDQMGFVGELHTLFTPEGWGREAHDAGMRMFDAVFACGYRVLVTFETDDKKSRPPRTAGYAPAGDWRESPAGRLRQWVLSEAAWKSSPAFERRERCRRRSLH
jgi:hypothetical protein